MEFSTRQVGSLLWLLGPCGSRAFGGGWWRAWEVSEMSAKEVTTECLKLYLMGNYGHSLKLYLMGNSGHSSEDQKTGFWREERHWLLRLQMMHVLLWQKVCLLCACVQRFYLKYRLRAIHTEEIWRQSNVEMMLWLLLGILIHVYVKSQKQRAEGFKWFKMGVSVACLMGG